MAVFNVGDKVKGIKVKGYNPYTHTSDDMTEGVVTAVIDSETIEVRAIAGAVSAGSLAEYIGVPLNTEKSFEVEAKYFEHLDAKVKEDVQEEPIKVGDVVMVKEDNVHGSNALRGVEYVVESTLAGGKVIILNVPNGGGAMYATDVVKVKEPVYEEITWEVALDKLTNGEDDERVYMLDYFGDYVEITRFTKFSDIEIEDVFDLIETNNFYLKK